MTGKAGVVTHSQRAPNSLVTATFECLQRKYGLFCLELKLNSCQQNLFDKMSVLFTFAIVLVNLERICR